MLFVVHSWCEYGCCLYHILGHAHLILTRSLHAACICVCVCACVRGSCELCTPPLTRSCELSKVRGSVRGRRPIYGSRAEPGACHSLVCSRWSVSSVQQYVYGMILYACNMYLSLLGYMYVGLIHMYHTYHMYDMVCTPGLLLLCHDCFFRFCVDRSCTHMFGRHVSCM